MEIEFREIKLSDILGLKPLLAELHEEAPWENDMEAAKLIRLIMSEDNNHIIVGTHKHVLVATMNITIINNLTRNLKPWAIIENVVVSKEYRNNGIGKQLINEARRIARDNNCYKLELISNTKRKDANAFYEKLGFNADVNGYREYL